eukprot:26084_1
MHSFIISVICLITLTISLCDNYFQDLDIFSPKTPFNECMSQMQRNDQTQILETSSYKYICVDSLSNNSISGFDVILEDFTDINCKGIKTETILSEPFDIECGSICDIIKIRHYTSIINESLCIYDNNIYHDTISVVGECSDSYYGLISTETFCPLKQDNSIVNNNTNLLNYYWHNQYYGSGCISNQLSRTTYFYNGCQSSITNEYIEILHCDDETNELLSLNLSKSIISNSGLNYTHSCNNYWLTHDSSSRIRPFDICYESYADSINGDWSFKYICEYGNDYGINYTINGYTVMKYYYNQTDCNGQIHKIELGGEHPYEINCGDINCPYVRWREYNELAPTVCDYNNYKEIIHAIGMCDDDGYISDNYFCTNDYFYINTYHNDKCINNGDIYDINSNDIHGISLSQYFFNGCNGLPIADYQIIECIQKPYTTSPTLQPTNLPSITPTTDTTTTIIQTQITQDDDTGHSNIYNYSICVLIICIIFHILC